MSKQETVHRPLSRNEIFTRFDTETSTSKHLLILYSLAIGVNAKTIVDLGLGQTTGALRAAALVSGAIVYSCDFDRRRFEHLLPEQDEHWKLYLESSTSFLKNVPEPIDLAVHDSAHDYQNVKRDLEQLIPKMRKFGIICVHDTQQVDLYRDMLAAVRDATNSCSVSVTNLPFSAGLAIIRIEESSHPPISPSTGRLGDGRPETLLVEFPASPSDGNIKVSPLMTRLAALKIKVGRLLRQARLNP